MWFIMKNLWWIFLWLFFLFMLFIISSNNPERIIQDTNGDEQSSTQGDELDIVDELIERLENEASEQDQENTQSEMEDSWDTEDQALEWQRQWFFSSLFNFRRDSQEDTDVVEDESDLDSANQSIENETESDISEWGNETSENITTTIYNEWWQTSFGHLSVWQYQINTSSSWVASQKNRENNTSGDHQAIGSRFQVATHSLRLNNKYFTETIWYLMKWDELVQLTEKNSYGCFMVDVVSSHTAQDIQGYVCEKYLEILDEVSHRETAPMNNDIETTVLVPDTVIWDLISITSPQFDIDNLALFSWDMIEQLSELDSYGCFTWRIHFIQNGWYKELLSRVDQFCFKDIIR